MLISESFLVYTYKISTEGYFLACSLITLVKGFILHLGIN